MFVTTIRIRHDTDMFQEATAPAQHALELVRDADLNVFLRCTVPPPTGGTCAEVT